MATILGGFPAELVDGIIDQVHCLLGAFPDGAVDDSFDAAQNDESLPTLMSCSLVCLAWLPRSRYHLFRINTVSFYNYTSFLELLANPYCSFLGSLRTMLLDERESDDDYYEIQSSTFE
ncbi:hypothetical protein DFS33DRAFT_1362940 [Desarmillaria ectypa]|nr:hypothetical protein DFS33DRAFT_1362940 [Desarmillaria ectypa]